MTDQQMTTQQKTNQQILKKHLFKLEMTRPLVYPDIFTILHNHIYRHIGQGACGSVWAAPIESEHHGFAMKRVGGGTDRPTYNDYVMHWKVFEDLVDYGRARVRVPRCQEYVPADNQLWWNAHIYRFPPEFRQPCNILITERIPPFPRLVREFIINTYCLSSLRPEIKSSDSNRDCLIRPYLGQRRRLESQSMFKSFSLRNFPLHIDQIEDLGLPAILYAQILAETLAELYWRVHVDANDVEFVLAPPFQDNSPRWLPGPPNPDNVIKSDVLGDHMTWLLDFDCCRHMPLNEAGVQQAVAAFYLNDPYFPRLGREDGRDREMWAVFRERFLEASVDILGESGEEARLPDFWVELVERQAKSSIEDLDDIVALAIETPLPLSGSGGSLDENEEE